MKRLKRILIKVDDFLSSNEKFVVTTLTGRAHILIGELYFFKNRKRPRKEVYHVHRSRTVRW